MASSPKEKFDAAVKVIRGLPKNGSFQPSHELMLKFYSYYKQATEGPCKQTKPGFWDLVNRKKWEAWSNLGDMDCETAMLLYVDELKKVSIDVRKTCYPSQIVETMPQTNAVSEFLQKLDNFYEMVEDSENQNTLKIMDKPWPNGPVEEIETETLSITYNVKELLKQDVKKWQDSSIITNGERPDTNGFHGSYEFSQFNGGSRSETESDEKADSQDDVDPDTFRNGEWEELKDERLTVHSPNDSETESEEFCDTSDEPLEIAATSYSQAFTSQLSPLVELSSTPISRVKVVHFDPNLGHSNSDHVLSDSPIVNIPTVSGQSAQETNVAFHSRLEGSLVESCDISVCRGGENDNKSQKAERSEGRNHRSTGVNPGSHSGSGDSGQGSYGSPGGTGGHRGSGPNPGGGSGGGNRGTHPGFHPTDLNEQIVVTLLRLQQDMSGVLKRLNSLEDLVRADKMARDKKDKTAKKGWWPLTDLSTSTSILIIAWPFIVHLLFSYFNKKNRKL